MATAESPEVSLQVAACAIPAALLTDRQTEHIRLANGLSQLTRAKGAGPALRRRPAQIGDRARRSSDRYSTEKRHIGRSESERAMHTDTEALRPAAIAPDDDVGRAIRLGQEIPKAARTAIADSPRPAAVARGPAGHRGRRRGGGRGGGARAGDPRAARPGDPRRQDAEADRPAGDARDQGAGARGLSPDPLDARR